MMLTTTEELEKRLGSRYVLVLLVAKRARMLREGAPKLVTTSSTNPISIALQEIAEGKLGVEVRPAEEVEAEAARVAEEARRLTPPIPILVDAAEIEASLAEADEEEHEEEHEEEPEEEIAFETGEEDEVEEPRTAHDGDSDEEEPFDEPETGDIVEE